MKFSRLEAMRLARDQREEVVTRPLRQRISTQELELYDMQGRLDAMSSIVTSEVVPYVIPQIGDMLAQRVETEIFKAMSKVSSRALDEVITVPLLANDVRFLRPDEATQQILDRAAATYRKDTRARGIVMHEQSVTCLRVSLPEVHCQVQIDTTAKRRRA